MIVIIDSGGANITSVISAFERMDVETVFTKSPDIIRNADKLILPGVGAAKDAMARLEKSQLVDVIRNLQQPVLGICLGMQLLFESSEEGFVDTLNVVRGKVKRFTEHENMTIPHMGWNNVQKLGDHPLTHNIEQHSYFYFVHSYHATMTDNTIGSCHYGEDFTAITANKNFMGCQFHPERSGSAGQKILKNFLDLKPC